MIKKLLKLAGDLDAKGYYKMADEIDGILNMAVDEVGESMYNIGEDFEYPPDSPEAEAEAGAWVRGFFGRNSKLKRYANVRVVHVRPLSHSRHPEASYTYRNGIELYPKFWQLPSKVMDFVFAHEIGHAVMGEWGSQSFMAAAGAVGVDPWDTSSLPFGQHNYEEAFADSFASYHIDGDVQRRYLLWAQVVEAALAVVKTASHRRATQLLAGD